MKSLYAFTLAIALAGCASLGLVAPQSLDESLATAQAQVSALELSAAQALNAGTIKTADAQTVLSLGDQATSAIAAAKIAESSGDTATAQGKLALATSLLAQLSAYLTAHGVK